MIYIVFTIDDNFGHQAPIVEDIHGFVSASRQALSRDTEFQTPLYYELLRIRKSSVHSGPMTLTITQRQASFLDNDRKFLIVTHLLHEIVKHFARSKLLEQ